MTLKKALTYFLLFFITACETKEEEKLCAAIMCDFPAVHIKLKYLDANTNQDLLFSPNAPYNKNNLKVYSNLYNQELSFGIDSSDKSNRYIILSASSSEKFTIKLADKPQDVITIETKFLNTGCCGDMQLKSLKLNQTEICAPCSRMQVVTIKK